MIRVLLTALLLVSFTSAPALAGKPDHDDDGHKNKHHDRDYDDDDDGGIDVDINLIFSPQQRDLVRGYHVEHYGEGHCPPGLAKKNNGCLPPGQAKKRYARGRPLPHDVEIVDLPYDLGVRLGPPPHGYRYGIIDGDVVKLAVGTLLVVDAIEGLTN